LTEHWFEPLADHLGAAYLRYSFTKGTDQEVGFLVDALRLHPGQRLLDVGCGPGRHAHAFAARGIEVVGIDIASRFVELAVERCPPGAPASFQRLDARHLPFDDEFDAAISLCQGAFGLVGPGEDSAVLAGIARALHDGGRFAVTAFSSYFQVRYPQEAGTFDVRSGVHHERTAIKNESGTEAAADLWTTCYTARELELLSDRSGLRIEDIWSVEPGRYERCVPTIESPELLVVGRK
jgi:ubiquinone/menaquinone biosynthesis C-methylase UbiE